MCKYKTKKELKGPKAIFIKLIRKVQIKVKKEHKIKFDWKPIGSGKRNLVVQNCSNNFFDLDYQINLTNISKLDFNAREIKEIFIKVFNECRTSDFEYCENSTQAITIKNNKDKFGADFIITKKEKDINYILYNKKNTNNANNIDYEWEERLKFKNIGEELKRIKTLNLWNDLREKYINKRHNDISGKKAYQILSETINEVLKDISKKHRE